MTNHKKNFLNERRRFFRIKDSVSLSYRFIDEQQTKHPIQTTATLLDNCSLAAALELINEESALIHSKLEKIYSDFADYLKLLDIKINLIAQAVIGLSNPTEVTASQTRQANISVSGVGFDCEELFKVGQYLEIKMLLVHSTVVITTYAKVIHCSKNLDALCDYAYFVGVDYVNMKESDSDLLSKHVAKKQLQQIRHQKELEHNAQ